jgi:hypothetical protein
MRKSRLLLLVVLTVFAFTSAFAQETTAGLQGTVKDPQGAVVSQATVEITGTTLIGAKSLKTDSAGFYRFANLPPGAYTVTVSAQGFTSLKQTGINLEVGKLPTLDLKLTVGGVEQTVEVSSEAPVVDVTTSKVQTTVGADVINGIPKGRSFQSVIDFAPGARNEPLQATVGGFKNGFAGYQVDGASTAENSYLVEGQETSDLRTGQSRTNVPFEFIQQVQVKSSGFEAEYGGALGGVVNVIQKRGSNAWHGSVFTYYQGDIFNANTSLGSDATQSVLRRDPDIGADTVLRLDSPVQNYISKKDHYRIVEPGFELGGYLLKDRIWAFSSFVPRYQSTVRNINFIAPTGRRDTFYNEQTYNALTRLDARVSNRVRLFGSWQYGYDRARGANSLGFNLPNADSVLGQKNTTAANNPDDYNTGIGYVAPSVIYNTGADISLTQNLIATTRYGYFFNDLQDRGLPVGNWYRYLDTNYPYTPVGALVADPNDPNAPPIPISSLQGDSLGVVAPNLVLGAGFQTMSNNLTRVFDKYDRKSFSQDLAWFKSGLLGTHSFKFGYAQNRLNNDVNQSYQNSTVHIGFGQPYSVIPSNQANCAAIRAQNVALYGAAGSADNTSCQGLWGTYSIREFGTLGKVSSNNHSLYFQDAWTLGSTGVTVNAGVRFDKESLPSYVAGFQGIDFGFGDKIAPRLGASWDVMRNGKLKIYGSYGQFYDIMKYELPRGSFGGDYWHDCVYTLDDPNFAQVQPQRDASGHYCPTTGPALGVTTGRFIENLDFRQPSNDPNNNLVDPNLKPMKQAEYVFGADWAITPNLGFESRYSRKRLIRTIEDAGVITPNGEQYYIVNPGEGINATVPASECVGCPANPKARRDYDAVEFRLTKRASEHWFGSMSYTYSRLYGNYGGLANGETSDALNGPGGRAAPNVSRSFDEPFMQFDSHGKLVDGPLPTDRPHTFKAFGFYRLKWWKGDTLIGASQSVFSGTPLTSYTTIEGAPVFVEGRGKWVDFTRDAAGNWVKGAVRERRTPMFSQTGLNLVQEFGLSKTNEALRMAVEMNIDNIFNQHAPIQFYSKLSRSGSTSIDQGSIPGSSNSHVDYKALLTGYDYVTPTNAANLILSNLYNNPDWYQTGRNMRFKVKVTF